MKPISLCAPGKVLFYAPTTTLGRNVCEFETHWELSLLSDFCGISLSKKQQLKWGAIKKQVELRRQRVILIRIINDNDWALSKKKYKLW